MKTNRKTKDRDNMDDIEELLKSGIGIVAIAKQKGFRHDVIQRHCLRNNIDYGKKNQRLPDLTGSIFDNFKILSLDRIHDAGEKIWLAECKCGKTFTIRTSKLKITPSCGCSDSESDPKFVQTFQEVPEWFWDKFKKGATERNLEFTISTHELWEIFLSQDKKCVFSGVELYIPTKKSQRNFTASIDRIDSKKGYIVGNIQWVHKTINMMKMRMSNDELIQFCTLISEHKKKDQK
jgi:hypothetical protein